jgi:23S rRNA pseudouridine1911/1915/1917 synthase
LGDKMEILYEDDRIIVCIKPYGVLSTDEPGGMPSLLRQHLGESSATVRTVHRLDQVVGGVMVYARTSRAAADLQKQMEQDLFQKEYWAIVHGMPQAPSGVWEDYLGRDKRQRKTYVAPAPGPEVRPARLGYTVLAQADGLSLVSVQLHTGRTHQIRCQFASRGLPLWGDGKYGAPEASPCIGLWSHCLTLQHPRTGAHMTFQIPPPTTYPWTAFEQEIQAFSTNFA